MAYDVDFLVIGAGSGGVRAARIAANHGAKVAVVEDTYLGGTCVNVGCVPKKFLVRAGRYAQDFRDAAGYGWKIGKTGFDWPTLIARKDREIARLNGIYGSLLEGAGVRIVRGHASLMDANRVVIAGGEEISAAKILIATGGQPVLPAIAGIEHAITSDQAFQLANRPERIIILGGGYIAVEFAGIFQGLGAAVTLVHRGELFLRGFDDDIRQHLAREMTKKGVDLRFHTTITALTKISTGIAVQFSDGRMIETDQVMVATGRQPRIDGLGLEKASVVVDDAGRIAVNDQYQTNVPSIYAVGDVIDRMALTPVAIREGHFVADQLFGARVGKALDYNHIATAVFSTPEIATIGLTEQQARADTIRQYQLYRTEFRPMLFTLADRDERALMKLIVAKDSRQVVGAHMIGQDAGEIIQGLAIAVTMGATKEDFDRTMAIHPTIAEEFVTLKTAIDL